jgi:formate dehydrogenase major subunit
VRRITRSLAGALRAHVGVMPNPASRQTAAIGARVRDIEPVVSVCSYCAVGCSQLIYARDGNVIDIEGNPESPINAGTLCPKGSATAGLINNPHRLTEVLHRRPYGTEWEVRSLDWAMDRIARLVRETRNATWTERDEHGSLVSRTLGIGHLGGATLDNEENYLIKKLLTAGLGIVAVENQARI